ncbi:MAG: ATP-binding cassette domain-containing protein, partial [Kiritimatiellae bacterium]|nr:ATP-binding cassette domain-containing protein [Kiritimatiellia bacterium]
MQNVSIRFGGDPLLDNVTLNIERGEHTCLVGRNGSGKSTLLRVIEGVLEPDSGEVVVQAGVRIAALPQEVPTDIMGTVREVVEAGMPRHAGAEAWEKSTAANSAITRLGLDPDADFASLSGGLKRRCLLARALMCEPDLLILDEPTNHLDIESVEWLEKFLLSRVPTFLFVTHDRVFLRHLAVRIIDIDRGKLNGWDCDYDTFLRRKQQVLDDEEVIYARMGKLLKKEEAWLRRGVKARTTRNEGRVRALMELRKRFGERRMEQGTGSFSLQAGERSGNRALRVKNLSFAYPGGPELIHDFSLDILRGERIGIVGPNGSGKSTLLKLLTGHLQPTSGEIIPGSNLDITYFDQLREQLNEELSVADNVAEGRETVVVNGVSRHIYAYLGDFLFEPERARTPVKALSGGERNRLLLARHFLHPGNLLALDEPTNDLDIETLDLLEEQLSLFGGTILLVSHDRAFLNDVVTSTLVFEGDGLLRQYPGGYDDWRAAVAAR